MNKAEKLKESHIKVLMKFIDSVGEALKKYEGEIAEIESIQKKREALNYKMTQLNHWNWMDTSIDTNFEREEDTAIVILLKIIYDGILDDDSYAFLSSVILGREVGNRIKVTLDVVKTRYRAEEDIAELAELEDEKRSFLHFWR